MAPAQLLRAADDTRAELDVFPAPAFAAELDRLLAQEWRYARLAEAAGQPPPSARSLLGREGGDVALSSSPSLSNARVLDFVLYCQFKVLARHLPSPAAREAFTRALGRRLLAVTSPDDAAAAQRARGDERVFRDAVPLLLDAFVRGGYMRSYTIDWGALPSLPDVPGSTDATRAVITDGGDAAIDGRCQIRLNGANSSCRMGSLVCASTDVCCPNPQRRLTCPAAWRCAPRRTPGGLASCRLL